MPTLPVVALIPAKPGSEDAVRDALRTLTVETRKEDGCVSYELYESQAQPGVFVTVESWRAPEDLDAHMKSAHIAAAFAAVGDQLAEQPAIHPLTPVDVPGA